MLMLTSTEQHKHHLRIISELPATQRQWLNKIGLKSTYGTYRKSRDTLNYTHMDAESILKNINTIIEPNIKKNTCSEFAIVLYCR